MREKVADFWINAIGQVARALVIGLYASVGVFVALGYDGFRDDPWRVLYGAATVFALRLFENVLPRPRNGAPPRPHP